MSDNLKIGAMFAAILPILTYMYNAEQTKQKEISANLEKEKDQQNLLYKQDEERARSLLADFRQFTVGKDQPDASKVCERYMLEVNLLRASEQKMDLTKSMLLAILGKKSSNQQPIICSCIGDYIVQKVPNSEFSGKANLISMNREGVLTVADSVCRASESVVSENQTSSPKKLPPELHIKNQMSDKGNNRKPSSIAGDANKPDEIEKIKPIVYIQYYSKDQEPPASKLSACLSKKSYRVPAIDWVSSTVPTKAEIRYIYPEDVVDAQALQQAANGCVINGTTFTLVPPMTRFVGKVPRQQFEIWFAKSK